jgi:hypothetical protein
MSSGFHGGKFVRTLLGLIAVPIVSKPPTFQRHTQCPSSGKMITFPEDGDGVCCVSCLKISDVSETNSVSILRENDHFP